MAAGRCHEIVQNLNCTVLHNETKAASLFTPGQPSMSVHLSSLTKDKQKPVNILRPESTLHSFTIASSKGKKTKELYAMLFLGLTQAGYFRGNERWEKWQPCFLERKPSHFLVNGRVPGVHRWKATESFPKEIFFFWKMQNLNCQHIFCRKSFILKFFR